MRRGLSIGVFTLLGALTVVLPGSLRAADTFRLDAAHSSVAFHVLHNGVANIWGIAAGPSGSFTFDDADASKSSVTVEVKADTITTGNSGRDNHIKGPDFFDAKQFPSISFKSTSVKKTGDKTYEATGTFTLHGVTKPLTVTLTKIGEGDKGGRSGYRAGFESTFTIKRSDFGIAASPDVVGDEVKLFVSLQGQK